MNIAKYIWATDFLLLLHFDSLSLSLSEGNYKEILFQRTNDDWQDYFFENILDFDQEQFQRVYKRKNKPFFSLSIQFLSQSITRPSQLSKKILVEGREKKKHEKTSKRENQRGIFGKEEAWLYIRTNSVGREQKKWKIALGIDLRVGLN